MALSKDESREIVYGMPYDEWQAKHQTEASDAQEGRVRGKPAEGSLTALACHFPDDCVAIPPLTPQDG